MLFASCCNHRAADGPPAWEKVLCAVLRQDKTGRLKNFSAAVIDRLKAAQRQRTNCNQGTHLSLLHRERREQIEPKSFRALRPNKVERPSRHSPGFGERLLSNSSWREVLHAELPRHRCCKYERPKCCAHGKRQQRITNWHEEGVIVVSHFSSLSSDCLRGRHNSTECREPMRAVYASRL